MHRQRYGARTELTNYAPSYVSNNVQLRSVLGWWRRVLPMNATPRAIPNQLGQRPVFLTYSDGENSSASVGVAVWRTALESPLAAVLKVSREVRMLW